MQRYQPFFDTYLCEAIIDIDNYFKDIEKKCKEFPKLFGKDKGLEHTCSKLSLLLRKYHINFIPQDFVANPKDFLTSNGFNKGATFPDKKITIVLYCNENINSIFTRYNSFKNSFYSVLKHELIHRVQYLKIDYNKLQDIDNKKNPDNHFIYLNDRHEIMAYAWQIVDYFRFRKATREQILDILREPLNFHEYDNNIISSYIYANRKGVVTDKSLKLLYKYAYEYAKEV